MKAQAPALLPVSFLKRSYVAARDEARTCSHRHASVEAAVRCAQKHRFPIVLSNLDGFHYECDVLLLPE